VRFRTGIGCCIKPKLNVIDKKWTSL